MTYVRKVGVEESKKRLEVLHTSCLEIINLMANENNQKEAKLFKDVINHILDRER